MTTTPDLQFSIETAEALRFAASPHLVFKLRVTSNTSKTIHSIILKCQVHLDVSQRHYSKEEQRTLRDLFGEPERWGETLRSLLWTNTNTIVPSFDGAVIVDLQIPCTFDFNVAATKYFAGLEDGDVPVSCYFSGTIFYADDNGSLRVGQVSWDKETSYRMPIRVWRGMMDLYYPNTAWLCLDRDVFERLYGYKTQHGIPTFEQTLVRVMDASKGVGR
jgi:hypothetical protein